MPGTYEKDKFDIAGFAVGIVDEKKILQKKSIKKDYNLTKKQDKINKRFDKKEKRLIKKNNRKNKK